MASHQKQVEPRNFRRSTKPAACTPASLRQNSACSKNEDDTIAGQLRKTSLPIVAWSLCVARSFFLPAPYESFFFSNLFGCTGQLCSNFPSRWAFRKKQQSSATTSQRDARASLRRTSCLITRLWISTGACRLFLGMFFLSSQTQWAFANIATVLWPRGCLPVRSVYTFILFRVTGWDTTPAIS